MVDRAFRATLRNFGPLFLLVAVVTIPLHLVYSVVFAGVIETRELHGVIEMFPESRQVRGVGRDALTQARIGLSVVTLLELIAIPFLASGVRSVLRQETDDDLPSVMGALRAAKEGPALLPDLQRLGPLLIAAAVSLLLGTMIERTGLLLLEFVPDERSFPFFGLMQGVSRAVAAPFFLVTLVQVSRSTAPIEETPSLY